jgi:hypothetical protein
MKGKIKTLEIKILKSKNDKLSDWAYLIKDINSDKFYVKHKKYLKKIFGKKPFDTIYKIDAKVFKNEQGYKDIQILKYYGTYSKA